MGTLVHDPFFVEMPKFFGMTFDAMLEAKHPSAWVEFELGECSEEAFLESFFADGLGARILLRGLALGWLSYFMFDFALDRGANLAYAETLAFSTLVFSQLWHVFDARTFTTIYSTNPFTNRYLLLAVGVSAILSIGVIYLPVGNLVFGTVALSGKHLLMVMAIAALPTFVLSAIKATFGFRFL